MPAEPSIGVIVPAWNAERWLGEALGSVLEQSIRPVDVVVVDDGSSDATGEIAEGFGSPVRVVRQANGGIGAARNRGLELIGGELLTFLDADDLLTAGSLACRVRALAGGQDLDMVFGGVRQFSEIRDGIPVGRGEARPGHLPTAMLARRRVLEVVGEFSTGTHVAEGLDWLLRAREQGLRELTIEDQVLWRRVHGENNSVRHRGEIGEYARALKASLDRRRAAAAPSGETQA
jgi:glycosyltransferase involved in cell wall biosynthesis